MAYIFISGIATAGKSFLARKVAQKLAAFHLDADTLRKEMIKDSKLEPWVNFYWNQDEKKYLTETSSEEMWQNLVKQSESFWPTILDKIERIKRDHPIAIFEGDTLLPHLANKDLDFPGIYLLGESLKQTFERNQKNPRWGNTVELQKLEAEMFFNCERKYYKSEAEKYGYKTFENSELAEQEVLKLLNK